MSYLLDDESPISEPFWVFESASEEMAVDAFLRRRFAETFAIISECLEVADPLDVVYPGNPGEYADATREIVALLSPSSGDLRRISAEGLDRVVREGLARRFGELPDDERVGVAVRLIREKVHRAAEVDPPTPPV